MDKLVINARCEMSKEVSAAEAKARLGEYLRLAESGEMVAITRYGRAVAGLVSAEDLIRLERLRSAGPEAGLAGLVGKWDDGEEFADAVLNQSGERSVPRALPTLE
jgi:prevent-host-death family protein